MPLLVHNSHYAMYLLGSTTTKAALTLASTALRTASALLMT